MKIVYCLFLLILTLESLPASQWERLSSLPEPNGGFICGVANQQIIVAGGTRWKEGTKHWLDTIWRFDPRRQAWLKAGQLPHPLAYAAVAQLPKTFAFTGGSDGTDGRRELYQFNGGLNLAGQTEQPSIFAGAAFHGGKLYLLGGGTDASDFTTWLADFRSLNPKTGAHTPLSPYPGGPVAFPALVVLGDELLVFTGALYDAGRKLVVNHDFAFEYSLVRHRWRRIRPYPFSVRGLAGVALDARHVYLGGGYRSDQEGFTAEAFIFDAQTGEYRPTQPLPYAASATLVKMGNYLYCLGGEDRKQHRSDAMHRLNWKELLLPSPR